MNQERIPSSNPNREIEEGEPTPETDAQLSRAQQTLAKRGLVYAAYTSPESNVTSVDATQETTGTRGRYKDNVNPGKYKY